MGLVLGNKKIGPKIHQWSVRSGPDCPGKTALCSKFCYAAHGHFTWRSVREAHARNRKESARANFVKHMNEEIVRKKVRIMRIHVDGDLYHSKYAKKWYQICAANPQVVFFIYTRSWRKPRIKFWVDKMATLANVSVWYSVDQETGEPKNKPPRVKLAYMQAAHDDVPPYKVDLFFRIKTLKDRHATKIECGTGDQALVCPTESGGPHSKNVTCTLCKFCYKNSLDHVRQTNPETLEFSERRVPLTMVA